MSAVESREKYCAFRLEAIEGECFVAVGDVPLSRLLNARYVEDRAQGTLPSLPDLLSIKDEHSEARYRLREVKFKLERRLVEKALRQLRRGLEAVYQRFPATKVDRVELVVALQGRALKTAEFAFLGASLGPDRFELMLDEVPQTLVHGDQVHTVSVLLL